jgi:hypothetical protein
MQVDFPSEIEDINDTDLDIMLCLYQNGSLWKMEVTRRINNRREGETLLNLKDSISKQAVAKRVERLHELDYLESSIVSIKRDGSTRFILGYSNTVKGEQILLRSVKLILKDVLSNLISTENSPEALEELNTYLSIYSDLTRTDVDSIQEFVKAEL